MPRGIDIAQIYELAPSREEFWAGVAQFSTYGRLLPLWPEMMRGMIATRATNEATAYGYPPMEAGRAQTRALYDELLAEACRAGYLDAPSPGEP